MSLLERYDQAAFTELVTGEYIDESGITQKGLDILKSSKGISDMTEVARILKSMWPTGSKKIEVNGRTIFATYTEAVPLIKKRLEQFTVKYGQYTGEQIIDAAKRYMSIPEHSINQESIQILKNWIFYDRVGVANTIDEQSLLLTFLEDPNAGKVNDTNNFTDIR